MAALPRRAAGYPACAGIDPHTGYRAPEPAGLPRMRGDRPLDDLIGALGARATPHARGSTLLQRHAPVLDVGYPACAGIDPPASCGPSGSSRLPRMRGDRPVPPSLIPTRMSATPHARGSTSKRSQAVRDAYGYPACAGIDPDHLAAVIFPLRLPRMRGDRPDDGLVCGVVVLATPHARGSTVPSSTNTACPNGYPACAGIDPSMMSR